MKAALFALCFLVGADYTLNQGMNTRRFMAAVVAAGQAVGAWVYYPAR